MPNPLTVFFGTIWGKVSAGLLVAVLLFAGYQAMQARHWHARYDNAEAGRQLEIAKHAVTRQSVQTCVAALDKQSKDVLDLKAAVEKRQAEAAEAVKIAQRASLSAETRARALEASAAGNRSQGACVGSAAFQAARGGL